MDLSLPVLMVDDVAKLLKIHRSTVYRMLKRGQIRAFKLGADWRFNREEVEEWIRDRPQGIVKVKE